MKRPYFRLRKPQNLAYAFLMCIMLILLINSSLILFLPPPEDMELTTIDVILRTALSSIFGYLMSSIGGNVISPNNGKTSKKPTTIGFTANTSTPPASGSQPQPSTAPSQSMPAPPTQRPAIPLEIQVITVGSVCLFCLIVMISLRHFSQYLTLSTISTATLSQYRDFISGGIGALIGLSKTKSLQE